MGKGRRQNGFQISKKKKKTYGGKRENLRSIKDSHINEQTGERCMPGFGNDLRGVEITSSSRSVKINNQTIQNTEQHKNTKRESLGM